MHQIVFIRIGSNNTNKLSPQELKLAYIKSSFGSNNTNKLSPQERWRLRVSENPVQIIQINLALKNISGISNAAGFVQIIQINLALKNR